MTWFTILIAAGAKVAIDTGAKRIANASIIFSCIFNPLSSLIAGNTGRCVMASQTSQVASLALLLLLLIVIVISHADTKSTLLAVLSLHAGITSQAGTVVSTGFA